jgi:hypothetical protein
MFPLFFFRLPSAERSPYSNALFARVRFFYEKDIAKRPENDLDFFSGSDRKCGKTDNSDGDAPVF